MSLEFKKEVYRKLVGTVSEQLVVADSIYKKSLELIQKGDLKSDGKYDTRSIEAGQLSGAQKKRVEELKIEIATLKRLDCELKNKVQIGALVTLDDKRKFFITPMTGGLSIDDIKVISIRSPLGEAMADLSSNDTFEFNNLELSIYKIF